MLSDEQIIAALGKVTNEGPTLLPIVGWAKFARVVEAEVLKQNTELIRQMLEALESATASHELGILQAGEGIRRLRRTITAARARLEPKP